jgi:hypothetical protein
VATIHAGKFLKFTEYYPTRSDSGRSVYVDPAAVVAFGEGGENHQRSGRTTWLEVQSGPNARLYVLEPIETVLDMLTAGLAERAKP